MKDEEVIQVNNLGKLYKVGVKQKYATFREAIDNFISFKKGKRINQRFWALRNVSFNVKKGEVIGVIGENGAGKSTLLKILSRITEPTEGEVKIMGKVASLLEVGTGFNLELTGRENIFLNGAILGMGRTEIIKRFDRIVEFSGVKKFLDTPLKRYSSGMYVRLAFSIAAHLEPDILLIDEVLAVGDIEFQKKCLGKIGDISKEGRTIIFVSHNMAAVKTLCNRCLYLKNGRVVVTKDTSKAIDIYLDKFNIKDKYKGKKIFRTDKKKALQVLSVSLINESNDITVNFNCDEPINIEFICVSRVVLPGLYGYLRICNKEGITVLVSDTNDIPPNNLDSLHPNKYRILITIPNRLLGHGDYLVYLNFSSLYPLNKDYKIDSPGFVGSFHVEDNTTMRGNEREGFLSTLLKWRIKKLFKD